VVRSLRPVEKILVVLLVKMVEAPGTISTKTTIPLELFELGQI
jgi:hypothetical protein